MCTGNLKFRKLGNLHRATRKPSLTVINLHNRRQDMAHLKLLHSLHRATRRKPRMVKLNLHRPRLTDSMVKLNLHRRRLTDMLKPRHRDSLHRRKHQVMRRPLAIRNLDSHQLTDNRPISTG